MICARLAGLAFSLSALGLLVGCTLPTAQAQPIRVPRIAFLSLSAPGVQTSAPTIQVFREGLRAQGYTEGQNIIIEYRFSEGSEHRLAEMVHELARIPVDALVAVGTPWASAASRSNTGIPVVMIAVADPVAAGLVASLSRPGGNVTGLTFGSPTLIRKQLDLLRTLMPGRPKVGVMGNFEIPGKKVQLEEAQSAASVLGLDVHPLDIRNAESIRSAFEAAEASGATSLLVLSDPITIRQRARITQLASLHRIPAGYEHSDFVEAGGLQSFGSNRYVSFRRAAVFVAKILRGAKPADLPVEEPSQFELVLNAKTAESLGITFPQSLLLQADRVIQ